MSKLLKVFLLSLCLLLVISVFVACEDGSADNGDQPEATTVGSENTPPAEIAETVKFSAVDQKADNGKILVDFNIPAAVAAKYKSVEVEVYHGDYIVAATTVNANHLSAIVNGTYGKLNLKLVGVAEDSAKTVLAEDAVNVWADEYNFAPLNATFPVTYFTLDLFSMGEDKLPGEFAASSKNLPIMADAPTFVSLERAVAYSWDNLPENVFELPNVSPEMKNPQASNYQTLWHERNTAMARYIKELYEINPDSFFNMYCVDNFPDLILKLFYANGIPEKNFHATMISDGTGTAAIFSQTFGGENAEEVCQKMEEEWLRLKAAAIAGEDYFAGGVYNQYHVHLVLAKYPMVIASLEDNVDWWCSRDLFAKDLYSGDEIEPTVYARITALKDEGKLKFFGINDMLKILDEEQQAALKKLFHFDSDMFSAAEESKKEALVIIGTNMSYEALERYVKLTSKLYGDDYVIYYKGHPGYPVDTNEQIMQLFDTYGVINLDASIAAELILFYCPDIYLVGWTSTTFKSVQTDRFLAVFEKDEETYDREANAQGYGDDPDYYCTYTGDGYIKIESDADNSVRYYDIANHTIVDTIPSN